MFVDKPDFVITEKTGELIKQWCEQGVDVVAQRAADLATATATLKASKTLDELAHNWTAVKEFQNDLLTVKDELKLKLTPKK